MPGDLKSGLLLTLYTTWLHNSLVIALVAGFLLTCFLMILKPKRRLIFFLLGFLFLILEFEYRKHFGEALKEQTINSIMAQGGGFQVKRQVEDFFQKVLPFALWATGWAMIFLGMIA